MDITRGIHDLGHEVGYHYEVLSKANGDYEKAVELFEQELSEFRKIIDVKTICILYSFLHPLYTKSLYVTSIKYKIKYKVQGGGSL